MAHLLCGKRRLPVHVSVAAGFEQTVTVAEWDLQRLRERQLGLPTWLRPNASR
jgi:hypothetical protein